MKQYRTDEIRNIAIIAHSGAGKTSLVEAMLFNGGAIERMGAVDSGNSVADYAADEIERRTTLNCSVCIAEWEGHKLNLIDTPGAEDFYGDLHSVLRVVDAVIVVVDATTGVEGGTEKVWEVADKYELPRLVFINKMDKENANFEDALASVEEILETRAVPIQLPIGQEDQFAGVVDVIQMAAYLEPDGNKRAAKAEIPAELEAEAEETREALVEVAAESDDELIEKFFEGELTDEEIQNGLQLGILQNQFTPVLCGAALSNVGVQQLMDVLVTGCPSPVDVGPVASVEAEEETRDPSSEAPMSAVVFKSIADPFAGQLSFFRVYSGILQGDTQVSNSTRGQVERLGKTVFMNGKDAISTPQVEAGDIGAITKLAATQTGDTLCDRDAQIQLAGVEFPNSVISYAIRPTREGDDEKLMTSLTRMSEEDPVFRIERNDVTKQLLVSGLGDLHLTINRERMKDKFGVETAVFPPKVPYRETIRRNVQSINGRHKRQSGGRGQFGDVWINIAPLQRGEGFEFVNNIVGGSIPRNYIPAVEKGIRERMDRGLLAGYPVVDIQIDLYDGKHHPVDSSDMAFQIAGSMAFAAAAEHANPGLLEPIMNVAITVPEQFMGSIIGDLNGRRGQVMGVEQIGRKQVIQANVPLSEMLRYSIDLKSMTSARGNFTMEFSHYEVAPDDVAQKVIAESKAEAEE
ncbi:MAG: elongation factor G [Candidatus Poribacteria bacterium]|nr:elongation factor G [Candidatus Poribacteria bacterium]